MSWQKRREADLSDAYRLSLTPPGNTLVQRRFLSRAERDLGETVWHILAQCFEWLGRIDEASLIYSRTVAIGPAKLAKFRDRLNRLQSQA